MPVCGWCMLLHAVLPINSQEFSAVALKLCVCMYVCVCVHACVYASASVCMCVSKVVCITEVASCVRTNNIYLRVVMYIQNPKGIKGSFDSHKAR